MINLSIIIVNYNGAKFLENCIGSIYQGTHRINFEIIFIDNNSSDDSVELVKRLFPKVKIIQNLTNFGFSKANNLGLKIYQGRYALLLNNDTVVKDGAFDRMVEFMDAHPQAGACGPKLLNPDGTPQHQGGIFSKRFWLSRKPVKIDYAVGAALMARRETIDKVGVMDENFFFSNDDLDWCRRIRKACFDVYFVPQAEVIHYGGFTIKKFNQRLLVEGFRGGLYFCKKHYGNFIYQAYRLSLAFSMLLAIIFSVVFNRKKLEAFLRIFWIAVKGEISPFSLSPLPLGEGNKRGEGKRLLLISNGHAEDLAAASIGANLREKMPDAEIKAIALVGLGKAYDKKGIENLGLRATLPSGGFAKEGLKHFWQDIKSGWFSQFLRHIAILKQAAKNADLVVAVGDAYVVALCGFFARKPLIFIDGPKSVKIEGYYSIEKWLMKKFCQQVIVQDQETADFLKSKGLPAQFLGSWVMDYVETTGDDFGISDDQTVIGILPGTREEAYDNLLLILDVFEKLYQRKKVIGLIASALDLEKIKKAVKPHGWTLSNGKLISSSGATAQIAEGKFGDVCVRSKLIIGLAGIANEQAVAFGKPVVCFPGKGAQTTLRRFQEIQKITGDSMLILTGSAQEKAEKNYKLLNDSKCLKEMGEIGKASKPQWGGVKRIVELVMKKIE